MDEPWGKRQKTDGGILLTKSEMELYEDQAQMFDLSMRQYAEYMKLLEAIEEKKAKTMRGQQRAEVRAKLITALTDGLEVCSLLPCAHLPVRPGNR